MFPAAAIHLIIQLIVFGIIFGLLYFLVQRAPFIPDPIRPIICWIILAIIVLVLIYVVLLPIANGTSPLLHA